MVHRQRVQRQRLGAAFLVNLIVGSFLAVLIGSFHPAKATVKDLPDILLNLAFKRWWHKTYLGNAR